MRNIICFFLCLFCTSFLTAQEEEVDPNNVKGFYFGPKLGLSLGTQNWNGYERQPMVNYHFALFTESLDPDLRGSLYAQLGYHARGSGLRVRTLSVGGFNDSNNSFIYRNLSLGLGIKKRFSTASLSTPYYLVGVRVEYNLSNNIAEISNSFSNAAVRIFYPIEELVRKVTYGISFGGGYEFYGSNFVQPAIEFTISPDLNFQYILDEDIVVNNPFNGQPTTLSMERIRNITFEISLVVRFLREVIYID